MQMEDVYTESEGMDGEVDRAEEFERSREINFTADEQAVGGVAAVMQIFMEERKQRQAEQAEERHKWKLEMQLRDEENTRREEYNRRQIEILQSLVHGVQLQGEAAAKRAEGDKDVRVPKLTEADDIVAYLTTFER